MPKVTEEYLIEKRNFIIECTNEVLKEKPLYQITMKDIIKKAGLSQGAIYRYYANIDEIYIDFINRNTTDNFLAQKIDFLLNQEQSEKIILSECIIAIGEYIEKLLKTVGGEICFELLLFYAYDTEKRNIVFPQLKFKQSLEYAQNRIVEFFINSIQKGIFHPKISVDAIIMFICVSIDGISQNIAMGTAENNNQKETLIMDVTEMFQTLAMAVVSFLEV